MKNYKFGLSCIYILILFTSCGGSGNFFDCGLKKPGVPCDDVAKSDQARIALDEGRYADAVALFEEYIAENPGDFNSHPLLSAAYAGLAGIDIFGIVSGSLSSGGQSQNLIESLGEFLPTPASAGASFDQNLLDVKSSVNVLKAIPASLRQNTDGGPYATSAALQLVLYEASHAIMLINKYSYTAQGLDPSKLSTMTEEDAKAIIDSLLSAGSVSVGDSTVTQDAVNEAYASIQSEPGGTLQEKIASYANRTRN